MFKTLLIVSLNNFRNLIKLWHFEVREQDGIQDVYYLKILII